MISLNNSSPKALEVSSGTQSGFYFYSERVDHIRRWYLSDDSETVLGGPFPTFDDLLRWAVEKEFVEPRSIGILAN